MEFPDPERRGTTYFLLSLRRYVVVQPEDVFGVVTALERDQPLVPLAPVSCLAGGADIGCEVHVFAADPERLQRLNPGTRPIAMHLILSWVVPDGKDVEGVAGVAPAESGCVSGHAISGGSHVVHVGFASTRPTLCGRARASFQQSVRCIARVDAREVVPPTGGEVGVVEFLQLDIWRRCDRIEVRAQRTKRFEYLLRQFRSADVTGSQSNTRLAAKLCGNIFNVRTHDQHEHGGELIRMVADPVAVEAPHFHSAVESK